MEEKKFWFRSRVFIFITSMSCTVMPLNWNINKLNLTKKQESRTTKSKNRCDLNCDKDEWAFIKI